MTADLIAWGVLVLLGVGILGYAVYNGRKLFRRVGEFILSLIIVALFWN